MAFPPNSPPPLPIDAAGDKIGLPDLSHEELALLLGLGERLVAELDLDVVLSLVADSACQVVQAETLVVPMISADRQTFTYRAASGKYASMIVGKTFPIHEGACGWVMSHQRPLLFGEDGTFDMDSSAKWQPGMPSSLLVPLICRGVIIGGLSAMSKLGGGAFNQRNLTVLTLFANQAGIAIDNARLFREMSAERTRLETILRTASDGIHILDGDGLLTEANDAFLKMLGYDRTAIGHVHVGDWDVQDKWEIIRARNNSLIDDKGTAVFETRHKRRDGKILDVEISACGLEIEGKRFLYAASRDITQRKLEQQQIRDLNMNLEARVRQRTEELARSNRELEAFSYSVSHDLRAPLRAIDGYSHILEDDYRDKFDAEGLRLMNLVRTNTQRMGQLIDDILDFSRMGRCELKAAAVDMNRLARDVAADLQAAAAGRAVRFDIAELPPAQGDGAMIRQILTNLLANAVKFTRARSDAVVEVRGNEAATENVYVVADNGVGFDMRYVDKLFGVFERLHANDKFDGTGIGLAIVKRVVERHGGRVWAEGKVGEGAAFHFTLPHRRI